MGVFCLQQLPMVVAAATGGIALGLEVVQQAEVPAVVCLVYVFAARFHGVNGSVKPEPQLHLEGLRWPWVYLCGVLRS